MQPARSRAVSGRIGLGSEARYVNDLTNVQQGLQAEVQAGQFQGDTLMHINTILADINTALGAEAAATGGDAAAQAALHNAHLDILNIVNGDANLFGQANGGFLAAPAAADAAPTFNVNRALRMSGRSSTISPINPLAALMPTTRMRRSTT